MDTSPEYILQCEKAEEIQRQFKEVVGDWLYMPKDGECAIVAENFREYRCLVELKSEKSFAFDDPYIWLPRQDQLQEMIHTTDWISVLEQFALFAFHGDKGRILKKPIFYGMGIPHNVSSMEQLWLAFVMSEKFHKIWGGENWV